MTDAIGGGAAAAGTAHSAVWNERDQSWTIVDRVAGRIVAHAPASERTERLREAFEAGADWTHYHRRSVRDAFERWLSTPTPEAE